MARGTQFSELQSMLKAETGRSINVGVGVDDAPYIQGRINSAYESLALEYDWPHLRQVSDRIPLAAGQRYYDFPADMDFETLSEVAVWWDSKPMHVERGIDFDKYSTFDSESDQRSDPVTHWEARRIADVTQFEVWPLPASNEQEIQFIGWKKINRLVNDDDECELDDWLVVYFAAINVLKRQKSSDADAMQALAQARLTAVRKRIGPNKKIRMGLGTANTMKSSRAIVRIGS